MDANVVIVGSAALLAGWIVLAVLGGERQRRINEIEQDARIAAAAKAAHELQEAGAAQATAKAQKRAPKKAA